MKATISRHYLARNAAIALFCIGVSGWFFYDGTFAYPAQRERGLAFEELKEEYPDLEEKELLDKWGAVAEERGWPKKNPGEPKTEAEIQAQLVLGGLVLPFGVLYLIFFTLNWRRWVATDEQGVETQSGKRLNFDEITRLDKKKWDAKGIARVHGVHDGRRRCVLLDDWKFETEPTRVILREIEKHLQPDQITGGPPEPPAESGLDAAAEEEPAGQLAEASQPADGEPR
jgi:hypothetical protein